MPHRLAHPLDSRAITTLGSQSAPIDGPVATTGIVDYPDSQGSIGRRMRGRKSLDSSPCLTEYLALEAAKKRIASCIVNDSEPPKYGRSLPFSQRELDFPGLITARRREVRGLRSRLPCSPACIHGRGSACMFIHSVWSWSTLAHAADVLSHPNRGMSRECEASTVPSHGNETSALLTWWDSSNGMRTCLMIDEITDAADCLTNLRHRR